MCDSAPVPLAQANQAHGKTILRLGSMSTEKVGGFSCLAIVNRVVTATPCLPQGLTLPDTVQDTPLQQQDPEVVALCLHHLQVTDF